MVQLLRRIKIKQTSIASILKRFTLLLLAIVIVVIGVDIISRSGKEANVSLPDEELDTQKIEQKEEVKYLEDEKGSPVLESQADRQYLGGDGFYHLEGNVLIKFLKRAEGEDVIFRGREILHDRDGRRFILKRNAEIIFKDLSIESSYLEYESKERLITTQEGVTFSSDRVRGKGESMICWERRKEVKIQHNVQLELIHDRDSNPIHVSGEEMFYTHKWGNGYVEGNVRLRSGKNSVSTERLEFYLPPKKEFLRSMILKGDIRGDLFLNEASSDVNENKGYEVKAEEVFIKFFKYLDKPQMIEAKGNCVINPYRTDIGFSSIQSKKIMVNFIRSGEIKEIFGMDDVLIEKKEENSKRDIKGNRFVGNNRKKILTVFGSEDERAEISSKDYDITADKITSHIRDSGLGAEGKIRGVFRSSENQKMGMGFFSSSQPVFISAEDMRYSSELERFIFKGNVKLWQEQEMLNTEELVIKEENYGLSAYNGVQTVLNYRDEQGNEGNIHISSKVLEYDPKENKILYEQECSMDTEDIKLNAESLSILMEKKENKIKVITANHSVIIEKGNYEGRSEKAVYNLADEMIVLTGNPYFTEKNRGETSGDKLTFSIADDRIIVENRGDERSVTVIKK